MSEHQAIIALLVVVVIAELVYAWFAASLANYYRKAYDSAVAEYHEAVRELNRTRAEAERLRGDIASGSLVPGVLRPTPGRSCRGGGSRVNALAKGLQDVLHLRPADGIVGHFAKVVPLVHDRGPRR